MDESNARRTCSARADSSYDHFLWISKGDDRSGKESCRYSPFRNAKKKIPDRRIDIVCFAKNIHKDYQLYPLLLIECKQDGKLKGALDQILGYNHYVGACFIAVATSEVFLLQYLGKSGIVQKELQHPPLYKELIQAVHA